MKTLNILIIIFVSIIFVGCEKDNFDAPKATLSGKVTYNNIPVGVRTNATQLELWQDGYALHSKIPVYIAHDGTFSASLFNGRYKLVRLAGGPWANQSKDTIVVDVKGNTVIDVPVTPYFNISNENFSKSTGSIVAKFTINKIVESANVGVVSLFLGKSILTDSNKKEGNIDAKQEEIVLGKEMSITANIPASLANADYIFVRVGVKATVSSEYYYTQVQKIILK